MKVTVTYSDTSVEEHFYPSTPKGEAAAREFARLASGQRNVVKAVVGSAD